MWCVSVPPGQVCLVPCRGVVRAHVSVCVFAWRVELKDVVRLLLERGANMDLATERADVDEVEVSPLGTEAAKHNQPCVT